MRAVAIVLFPSAGFVPTPEDPRSNRTVLHYQILEKLGSGGMGEIYKAHDTRLNRFVALKVLPAHMSADPDRQRRFMQEAQASSALNHPNIITIFDIVSEEDTQYMVVEYIDGATLRDLIPKDGLRVPQAIQYASQIVAALIAAHNAGIIHRDLKPANIMISNTGRVKLLDFGLAKILDQPALAPDEVTATMSMHAMTVEGTLLGTVNYMSPEQAEGKKLDVRSDIFSFGAVLYEMLTGRFAFQGASIISTLSAVLRDEIRPITEFTPEVPAALEQIVMRCLKKNRDERYQSMEELQLALAPLQRQSESGALYNQAVLEASRPVRRSSSTSWVIGITGIVLVAGALAYWVTTSRPPAPPAPVPAVGVISTVPPKEGLTNEDIIGMTRAKVAQTVILGQIRTSKNNFNLSASEVIRLTEAGVAPAVIETMRDPQAANLTATAAAPKTTAPLVFDDGLPVRLTLAEDIPATAHEADPVKFTVSDDVRVGDTVLIRKGAVATGTIVDEGRKKLLGFGSKMTFRLGSVVASDGQNVSLRATADRPQSGLSKRAIDSGGNGASGGKGKAKGIASPAGTVYIGYVEGKPVTVPPAR